MKKEGLIKRQGNAKNSLWSITTTGKEKLLILKKSEQNIFSRANVHREKLYGDGVTVIAFDIPERERKKRDWLRASLVSMEFRCLQKSVWIHTGTLSEKFIHALHKRKMLDYVHIFSITKKGTIQEI